MGRTTCEGLPCFGTPCIRAQFLKDLREESELAVSVKQKIVQRMNRVLEDKSCLEPKELERALIEFQEGAKTKP